MGLFDDAKSNSSLFLNPVALDYEYQPKMVPYRENQQHFIATCIKPLFQKRNGRNLFIFGKPGIGKTVATKHVLNELEEQTDDILPIYINGWRKNTPYKILLEICEVIGYKFTQNKKTEELFQAVLPFINKKALVLCLDEVDKVKEIDILYSFLEDIYNKTIILITNEKYWLDKLDTRIKSRLLPEILEFKTYNFEEVQGILKQRIEHAFIPNVFDNESLKKLANKTFDLGDLRTGMYLLKESGDAAELRQSKKIEIVDIDKALDKLNKFKIKSSEDLNSEQSSLLDLIENNQDKSTTELHKLFNSKISYKSFKRRLDDLKNAKLIDFEEKSLGAGGRVTKVSLPKKLNEF